ncbi:MAG: MarR family transcriptional regulator [Bacteroidales bacterium]|nr:MarR family transcriptional regulator [Bacteroidales bacterium]
MAVNDCFDPLKLENQICFPLYVAAKEVVKRYRPLLDPLGLTYTQYIAMMVMWEHKSVTVGKLCELLCLDTGTLTPMLKKMEAAGLVERRRSKDDERSVIVSITETGEALRAKASEIPARMAQCVSLSTEDAVKLLELLNKIR